MKVYLPEYCLGCGKEFDWHEVIIVKYPEGACFGLCCENRYEDSKKYDLENEGWIPVEYEPGLYLSNDE